MKNPRAFLSWIGHELTRPRGLVRHRFYRHRQSSRAGVAMLVALSAILLLTVIATEIRYKAEVNGMLAVRHREEAMAEALAMSGVGLYQLILVASKALGRNPMIQQFGQMFGMNGDSLWQFLPKFNTGLLRMIFVSGGDMDEDEAARMQSEGLSEEELEETREAGGGLRRNFLDFVGDFDAHVIDEARHVYVGNLTAATLADLMVSPAAMQLQGLMAKEEYNDFFYKNNIDRIELISNLVDWTDPDNNRLFQGGPEDSLYQKLEPPYLPKNAPFDTRDEIRLVEGWHLDGVWQRIGKHLTIYGGGKVNVNTAERPVIRGLLAAYAEGFFAEQQIDAWVDLLLQRRGAPLAQGGVYFNQPQQFQTFVETEVGMPLRDEIVESITTESTVFRVVSTGVVGDSRVEILVVFDFTQSSVGQILYWRVR